MIAPIRKKRVSLRVDCTSPQTCHSSSLGIRRRSRTTGSAIEPGKLPRRGHFCSRWERPSCRRDRRPPLRGPSGLFPVERALVSAALLSHAAERLAAVRPEKAARAAELVPGAGSLVERINAALDSSGIPFKLRDVGLNLDRLVSVAEAGRALEFVGQSPWTASAEDVFDLLRAAY